MRHFRCGDVALSVVDLIKSFQDSSYDEEAVNHVVSAYADHSTIWLTLDDGSVFRFQGVQEKGPER